MRKLYIAGNWKMNLVPSEAAKYAKELAAATKDAKVKIYKQDEFNNPLDGAQFELYYMPNDVGDKLMKTQPQLYYQLSDFEWSLKANHCY